MKRSLCIVILMTIAAWSPAQETATPLPSLLPAWQQLERAPVLHYQWNATEAQRQAYLADFLAMGFTGIYKLDQDPPWGGKLFVEKDMHGLMRQTRFLGGGDPVMGHDGQPAPFPRKHPYYKSIVSERNATNYYARIAAFAKEYGQEYLFQVDNTIIMSSWDETGLYSRRQMEYGYNVKEKFLAFLSLIFQDEAPHQDSNRDGTTFNSATGLDLESWDAIEVPTFKERYERPGLWKYWVDFHGYYTYRFFRDGTESLSLELEQPVELFAFSHGTIKWPGASSQRGLDYYWQSKLNRVLTIEDCSWDYPGSTIHYAISDQFSRRYGHPVLGWSWFSPEPQRANEPNQVARALARVMGHNTHGMLMWVYTDDWRVKPEARAEMARWHHLYQAHWPFLRQAMAPAPQVAVLYPRNSGNMYPGWDYPKLDFGWTCQALSEAQIPFEVIADNQLEFEPAVLDDYRVLLMPTTTWQSPKVREVVGAFIESGGYVYTNGDSTMLDTAGGRTTPFLPRYFGIRPTHKYKGTFMPTRTSAAEAAWAAEHVSKLPRPDWEGAHDRSKFRARGEKATAAPLNDDQVTALRQALPKTSGTGLQQTLYDPRRPQLIQPEGDQAVPTDYRTYHDIVTGDTQSGAKVLARYGTEVAAVETERTVWTGFRPGFDHACLFPIYNMRSWGEPIWPFEINQAISAAEREGPRRWLCRIVDKAGVERPLVATLNGQPASHIEILTRVDPAGNRLVWLINHEEIGGVYTLAGPPVTGTIAELFSGKQLEADEANAVSLQIDPGRVAIVAIGTADFVNARLAAQQQAPTDIPAMPTYDE